MCPNPYMGTLGPKYTHVDTWTLRDVQCNSNLYDNNTLHRHPKGTGYVEHSACSERFLQQVNHGTELVLSKSSNSSME